LRGYVGEIFSSVQGEGLLVGRRQVFIRFAGCSLRCSYCDTRRYRDPKPPECGMEVSPGTGRFRKVRNPLPAEEVAAKALDLLTPDTHSISLTGGEPLEAGDFLVEVASSLEGKGAELYLETNGSQPATMEKVLPYLRHVSLCVKLRGQGSVPEKEWEGLFEREMDCARMTSQAGTKTFLKVVIRGKEDLKDFEEVCDRLAELGLPLVLQPATMGKRVVPLRELLPFSKRAAEKGVREIALIPQVHRLWGIR
jgi:organic radical activating enzyme